MIRALALAILIGLTGAGQAGVEENRLEIAEQRMPDVVGRYQALIDRAATVADEQALVALGSALWRAAVADVQSGRFDDRALYWSRLAIRAAIQQRPDADFSLDGFERSSRGMADVDYPAGVGKRVLITGFDPFHLDEEIGQSNPSGLAALWLDGRELATATAAGPARIEAAIAPVRFGDFDEGLIESFLRPHLEAAGLDLLLTVSMGRDAFDLERFPGRRRSAAVPDNRNVLTGASSANPMPPVLLGQPLAGPEFVEFSLPAAAMKAAGGRWAVRDNRSVRTLEHGEMAPASLSALAGLTAVSGSGGGYLSNEISYRAVLLAGQLGATVPVGHLHTPRLQGWDPGIEREMVEQIRRLLVAGIEALR